MDRKRKVDAILSTKVVLSKGEYINHLLNEIIKTTESLTNALENDKFHLVGRDAGIIEELSKDLKIAFDA